MDKERWVGRIAGLIANIEGGLMRVEGERNLFLANEYLREHSLVVVSNHPNSIGAVYGIETILQYLGNRGETGIVMTSKFFDGEMGKYGRLVMGALQEWGMEPIRVYQHDNNRVSQARRMEAARTAIVRSEEILSKPGGVVLIYPEGTRTTEKRKIGKLVIPIQLPMVAAQRGAVFVGEKAGMVLPIVTEYKIWSPRPEVKALPMVDVALVYENLCGHFSRREARQLVVDGLMTMMAMEIPRRFRGHYAGVVEKINSWDFDDPNMQVMWQVMKQLRKARKMG